MGSYELLVWLIRTCGAAGCGPQPPGRLQEIGVRAQNRCQAACPGGDALDVRPATGEGGPSPGSRVPGNAQNLWIGA